MEAYFRRMQLPSLTSQKNVRKLDQLLMELLKFERNGDETLHANTASFTFAIRGWLKHEIDCCDGKELGSGCAILCHCPSGWRPCSYTAHVQSCKTLDCIGALGPDVIFDLAYRNTVLVAAGPLVRTPEPMMWMRLVPLLPILHRLGAIQHFSRAYGGAPSFAERPDTITYIELTTSGWTTEPPIRTPVYSPDMPVPPPPDTASTDEVDRILVADMPPHDRQRYGRVGSGIVRRVSPSCTMRATVENYLPATMNTGAHFTLRYTDGGRERLFHRSR